MLPKKIVAVVVSCALCALSAVAFAGCGGMSDEDAIRQAISKEFDAVKNLDANFMEEFGSGIDAESLEVYGIDTAELVMGYLEGFDYEIQSVTVDGETADAVVVLTCKSYTGFETELMKAAFGLIDDPSILLKSEEELNAMMGPMIMEALANVELAQTDPITLTYKKSGKDWQPDASVSGAISDAMTTN